MAQAASSLGRLASRTGSAAAARLVFYVVLVLAAGSARPMPAGRVEAAPPPAAPPAAAPPAVTAVSERFHFSLANPGRLCVGRSYSLRATMLVDFQVAAGSQNIDYQDRVVPGITIQAKVDDDHVAGVTPAQLTSGALQADLLASPPFGNANGLGEVVFSLQAKKAGLANVIAKATIPSALTGGAAQPIAAEMPIKVENCKYKVTINGAWARSYPNLRTRLTEQLSGEMTRDDNGHLSGSANVVWSLRSASVMCAHSHSITLGQAALSGEQSEDSDSLSFKITYESFELATVNCASSTQGQIQVAPIELNNFPATGISAGITLPFPVGNEDLIGKATLSITPIPLK